MLFRSLSAIKEKGFIDIAASNSGRGMYRRNCIKLACPQDVLDEILESSKDRFIPSKTYNTEYLSTTKMTQYYDKNAEHSFNNRYMVETNIKTNIRETSPLCDLEPVCEASENPLEYRLESEPVEQNVPRETFLEEPQGEMARFITKAERKQIVTKVKAMKRDGEIHPKVQANYQDIMVLVNHIIIHCVYRKKFKSFKHSLRSAATGLRNGTWTTPKRVLAAETAERERLANEAKEQERRQCLESGFGRILGEAMRLTHGPSEADLARAKAQAVNEVVQAVGNNRAADYLQKIKDILKKPTERKEEERKK